MAGAEDRAPTAQHRGDDDLHADRDVDEGADRRRAHVEHHQRAGEAREEGADDEGRELVLGDVEAERTRLHGVLAARLQDEPDRRARQPEENDAADRHEAERDPVIDVARRSR